MCDFAAAGHGCFAATPVASVESWLTPTERSRNRQPARTAHGSREIATILNERGFRSGQGIAFHSKNRLEHPREYRLKSLTID